MRLKKEIMRFLSCLVITIFLPLSLAFSDVHEGRRIPVIVDTDVALDDLRALALLVQSDDIYLLAVVTSDGACTPYRGAQNIRRVLHFLGKSDIPVAAGKRLDRPPPSWRPMSETLGWSELGEEDVDSLHDVRESQDNVVSNENTVRLITQIMKQNGNRTVYLCLGPLTNLASILKADTSLIERIDRIYYSGTAPDDVDLSWNTSRDIESTRRVFRSGIPIRVIHLVDNYILSFDRTLFDRVRSLDSPAAEMISQMHSDERVLRLVDAKHFRCWDEMVVLSLLEPALFTYQSLEGAPNVEISTECNIGFARLIYLNLLANDVSVKRGHRESVILAQYPIDSEQLKEDIKPLAPEIIEKHGLAEWNAALISSELHRHLGVYSLIGAKMGIRAREILDAGVDELQVISHAGREPPLSCMTDGLQVATGASLGRGTITIDSEGAEPKAVFIDGKRHLILELKNEVLEQIRVDFRDAIEQYGALTPEYWDAVRKLALQYWLKLDRRRIFHEAFSSEDSYNVK